jgi:uncharacterized membrane protein
LHRFSILSLARALCAYGPRDIPRRRLQNRVNPLELAKARLAKGEITFEEFEEIKKAIQNS